jgi:Icc-related predicted phosphoesterase
MRVCFTSDLHGSRTLYEQLAVLVREQQPGLLVLGGDLLGDVDRDRPPGPQLDEMHRDFLERLAGYRGTVPGMTVACIVGNHELWPTREALAARDEAGDLVLLDERHVWEFGGYAWLGYACAPPSPHWAKDFERLDRSEDDVPDFAGVVWDVEHRRLVPVTADEHFRGRETLSQALAAVSVPRGPWVLVAHAPPHGSHLDRLPTVPHPIGSRAVRAFIERGQPTLALHGHVHESPATSGSFVDRIGETLCVNPGQVHGRLQAVVLDLDSPGETIRHTEFS